MFNNSCPLSIPACPRMNKWEVSDLGYQIVILQRNLETLTSKIEKLDMEIKGIDRAIAEIDKNFVATKQKIL